MRALRPQAELELRELRAHQAVVVEELTVAEADAVEQMLARTQVFDVLAGHVVHVATRRGWPVVTGDPARSRAWNPISS